jgi:ABC-type nitrate/sulfonate/bicarbonate transport system substrate-binding protein
LVAALLLGAGLLWPRPSHALDKVPFGALTFPTLVNTTGDIIKANGFDKANGIDAVPDLFGSAGAQYAAMAKGEIVAGVVSPFQLVKMRAEGVPAVIVGTLIGMQDIQVLTRTPAVETFADVKGRSLAATVGFSEFQYIEMYARKIDIELKRDVNLVDASTSLAMAQLQAHRVDAIIVWEPSATAAMRLMPDARVILTGDAAWKALTGNAGWDVVLWVNDNWAKTHASVVPRLMKMYEAYGTFLNGHPEEADAIITSGKYLSKGLPPGTVAEAIRAKRLVADVHPAWDPTTNQELWQVIRLGLANKEIDALPNRDAVMNAVPTE